MNKVTFEFQFLTALVAAASIFAMGASSQVEEVEPVETIEIVQLVETGDNQGELGETSGGVLFIGRFHAAAVHFPIGFVVGLLLIELFLITSKGEHAQIVGVFFSVLTVLSFLPALTTGFIRGTELSELGSAPNTLVGHRNVMVGAFIAVVGVTFLRLIYRDKLPAKVKVVHLTVLALAVVLALLGGHWGGQMVYGDGFSPF